MKTDYPELEDKKISIDRYDVKEALVIGVSYHVGITIVAVDSKVKLLCLNRKLHNSSPSRYRRTFQECVKMIKAGKVDGYKLEKILYNTPKTGAVVCAFE